MHAARKASASLAVGAVSGTVLSFELGLLWPTFMEHAGAIIGGAASGKAGGALAGGIIGAAGALV